MNRRSFLLSLPLIGAAAKALAEDHREKELERINEFYEKAGWNTIDYRKQTNESYDGRKFNPYEIEESAMWSISRNEWLVRRGKLVWADAEKTRVKFVESE